MHGLSGEVVEALQRRRLRPGDHQLAHRLAVARRGEIHLLQPVLGLGQVAGGDIAKPRHQVGQQAVARGRDDDDGQRALAELVGVFLVQVALEVTHQLRGQTALAPLVAEVKRAAVWHQHADDAALEHHVEVAGTGLVGKVQATWLGGTCLAWRSGRGRGHRSGWRILRRRCLLRYGRGSAQAEHAHQAGHKEACQPTGRADSGHGGECKPRKQARGLPIWSLGAKWGLASRRLASG
ncbi:hypothetical protein D9M68_379120 [compost metagenome]